MSSHRSFCYSAISEKPSFKLGHGLHRSSGHDQRPARFDDIRQLTRRVHQAKFDGGIVDRLGNVDQDPGFRFGVNQTWNKLAYFDQRWWQWNIVLFRRLVFVLSLGRCYWWCFWFFLLAEEGLNSFLVFGFDFLDLAADTFLVETVKFLTDFASLHVAQKFEQIDAVNIGFDKERGILNQSVTNRKDQSRRSFIYVFHNSYWNLEWTAAPFSRCKLGSCPFFQPKVFKKAAKTKRICLM